MDSDDWLDLNAYEMLINNVKDKSIDILSFWPKRYNSQGTKVIKTYKYSDKKLLDIVINVSENLNIIYAWHTMNACKLYKRDFLIENELYYKDYESLIAFTKSDKQYKS